MKESHTAFNVAVVLFAAFGSWTAGWGLAAIIATLGQPTWYASLDLTSDPKDPRYAYSNSVIATTGENPIIPTVGFIGSALQTGAVSSSMYITARAITGFVTGQMLALMPGYFSEVAPPHYRGLMAGAHGSFINFGYATANWIGFGTFERQKSSFSWRFPQAMFVILCLLLLGGTLFMPESPRWLVARGHNEKALDILCKLHNDRSDPRNTFAHQELSLIETQLDIDETAQRSQGRFQILTVPSYRKRLALACMIIIGTQNTGVLVINSYNALLYQSLGLSNLEALIVSAAYNTFGALANFLGATISDRFGRRRVLIIGFTSTLGMLAISTGLIAKYDESPAKGWAAAALTCLFLYVFCHACFIDVNCWTVATEIFPTHLRPQGTGIAISTFMLTDILWLQLAPTASATIGWKYYLVFIGLTICHTVYY